MQRKQKVRRGKQNNNSTTIVRMFEFSGEEEKGTIKSEDQPLL